MLVFLFKTNLFLLQPGQEIKIRIENTGYTLNILVDGILVADWPYIHNGMWQSILPPHPLGPKVGALRAVKPVFNQVWAKIFYTGPSYARNHWCYLTGVKWNFSTLLK